MKSILTVVTFLFIATCSQAQDYIVKRNGTKIEAKVIEITDTEIKYRLFTQPNGPLRIVAIRDVEEIIYEDGQFDKFEQRPADTPRPVTSRTPVTREPKDPILKGGFFIEALIGYGGYEVRNEYMLYDYYGNYIGTQEFFERHADLAFTIRLGNKWYFGQNEKWRPGLQATWLRLGNYIDTRNMETMFIGTKTVSLANVGMTNAFRFTDDIGMEANFSVGPTIAFDLDNGRGNVGMLVGPEVKFRFRNLAVGVDYAYIWGDELNAPDNFNVLSLSIGAKF